MPEPSFPLTRSQALTLIRTLQADLLSNPSATYTLEHWCTARGMAGPGRRALVTAEVIRNQRRDASSQTRQLLAPCTDETIRYRRVRLRLGEIVLSEADNWYVPSRLSEDMNAELDGSGTPFGKVVQPLAFRRQTLASRLIWQPFAEFSGFIDLAEDAQADNPKSRVGHAATMPEIPYFIFENHAFLEKPDGTPFSVLIESYTRNILAGTDTKLATASDQLPEGV